MICITAGVLAADVGVGAVGATSAVNAGNLVVGEVDYCTEEVLLPFKPLVLLCLVEFWVCLLKVTLLPKVAKLYKYPFVFQTNHSYLLICLSLVLLCLYSLIFFY